MLEEKMVLRNYAHIGDAIWEVFVRDYTILKTSNAKLLHKLTTDRVNANFQKDMLVFISDMLTEDEKRFYQRKNCSKKGNYIKIHTKLICFYFLLKYMRWQYQHC